MPCKSPCQDLKRRCRKSSAFKLLMKYSKLKRTITPLKTVQTAVRICDSLHGNTQACIEGIPWWTVTVYCGQKHYMQILKELFHWNFRNWRETWDFFGGQIKVYNSRVVLKSYEKLVLLTMIPELIYRTKIIERKPNEWQTDIGKTLWLWCLASWTTQLWHLIDWRQQTKSCVRYHNYWLGITDITI